MLSRLSRSARLVGPLLVAVLLPGLASAQQVLNWGSNVDGGNTPPVAAQSGVVKIVEGYGHNVALKNDGSVVAWGNNFSGQSTVPPAALSGVVDVAAGGGSTLALKSDGSLVGWGDNSQGQLSPPAATQSGVIAISGGSLYYLALKSDGSVVAWGANGSGQCNVPASAKTGIVAISGGVGHGMALKGNGKVLVWGNNGNGQTTVPVEAQSDVIAISAGGGHCLALKKNGSVVAWGWNDYGQCNVPASAQSDIVAVSAGNTHSLALKSDGTVIAWGDNSYGMATVPGTAKSGVVGITAGDTYSFAIRAQAWVTLNPTSVFGGDASVGTVHLANPALTGGATVDLHSGLPYVHVPATVDVAEGATTATFPVTVDAIGLTQTVGVGSDYGGTPTVIAVLKVKPTPAAFALNKGTAVGGSNEPLNVTVTLDHVATFDVTFSLSAFSLTVPATITVPAGQQSATVEVVSPYVNTKVNASVDLSVDGVKLKTATMKLTPLTASLAPQTVPAGSSTFLTLNLNAPVRNDLAVTLASSDPKFSIPPSVTVAAGQSSGLIYATVDETITTAKATVTMTPYWSSYQGTVTISIPANVKNVALPTTMFGKTQVMGTVTLDKPAISGGQSIMLSTDSGSPLSFYPVYVSEGQKTANFPVFASDVASATSGVVHVKVGKTTVDRTIQVVPNGFVSLVYSADTVKGGNSITATLTINAAPTSDITVSLAPLSGASAIVLPSSVIVRQGNTSVAFTVSTKPVTSATEVNIRAFRLGTLKIEKAFTITP